MHVTHVASLTARALASACGHGLTWFSNRLSIGLATDLRPGVACVALRGSGFVDAYTIGSPTNLVRG